MSFSPSGYSCFIKGCPTKLKHIPQCRLIVIVYRYLIEVLSISARRKGKHEYMCLCCFLLSHWNTLQLQSRHLKPPIMPFDIVAYAYMLLWDNLSQNSCILSCVATVLPGTGTVISQWVNSNLNKLLYHYDCVLECRHKTDVKLV